MMFEPTKGLVAIACDATATTTILPCDVLHIDDQETYEKVLNGEVELVAKVVDGRLTLSIPTTTTTTTTP
jgi:hypothetical protein